MEGTPDGSRRLHSAITLPSAHGGGGLPPPRLLSDRLNVTSGNVSFLAGLGGDPKRLRITAPVQPGNRGGPLLDAAGNVIGVVVSKLDAVRTAELTGDIPQNADFAVKGALVRGFLDIHGVACRRRTSDMKLTPELLAERARAFTVAAPCREQPPPSNGSPRLPAAPTATGPLKALPDEHARFSFRPDYR